MPGYLSFASSPFGNTQINIGGADLPGAFMNFMKAYGGINYAGTSPGSDFDSDGYPITTLSANVGGAISMPSQFAANGVDWIIRNTGTRVLRFVINVPVTKSASSGGATTTGGSNSTMTVTMNGAGSVTFQFNNFVSSSVSFYFPSGFANVAGTGSLDLLRLNDVTTYDSGEYFTSEFTTLVRNLRARTIRPMGWTSSNDTNETRWAYRTDLNTLGWSVDKFPTGVWGGTISGTDTYTIAAAPDTPGSWTDGEVIQGIVTNANTSTTPTLNVNSRGAKTIVNMSGNALSAGSIATGSRATFIYDAIVDKVYYRSGGITPTVPVEVQAYLANKLNANLWTNCPPMFNDASVTSWATTIKNTLRNDLIFYPEIGNETWNFQFAATQWGYKRGLALGFPDQENRPKESYFGLRNRQIFGNIIPSVFSGQMSRVRRVATYQAGGADYQAIDYRFSGKELAPSGTGAGGNGTGNSTYNTFTGSADYTTFPNRPIDFVEVIGYAPYAGGTNLCTGNDVGGTPSAANSPFYQNLVNLWDAGNTAAAIALVDDDIKQGMMSSQTVTASGTTFTTPLAHGFVANTSDVAFIPSGGTSYSGLVGGTLYRVTSTPTTTTFTVQAYINGSPSGSNINAGSAGTGTVTVGLMPYRNLLQLANTWYLRGEVIAATFDASRPAGMEALRQEQYEGGLEPKGPSVAQCTSLGITGTNPSASIDAAIIAWKNDPVAATRIVQYFNQFMGLDATTIPTLGVMAHSKFPSNLTITGPNQWALLPGNLFSTPFQTYYGFAGYR